MKLNALFSCLLFLLSTNVTFFVLFKGKSFYLFLYINPPCLVCQDFFISILHLALQKKLCLERTVQMLIRHCTLCHLTSINITLRKVEHNLYLPHCFPPVSFMTESVSFFVAPSTSEPSKWDRPTTWEAENIDILFFTLYLPVFCGYHQVFVSLFFNSAFQMSLGCFQNAVTAFWKQTEYTN